MYFFISFNCINNLNGFNDVIKLKKNDVYWYRNFDVSVTVVNVPIMDFPVIDRIVYGVLYGYIRGNVRSILELTPMHIRLRDAKLKLSGRLSTLERSF